MLQQKVSLVHLPLLLVLGAITLWLFTGIYLLLTPVPKIISQTVPTASADTRETEFVSNQLLVKITKSAKSKVTTNNPQETGLNSLDNLSKKSPIKNIEKVAKENAKSKKDQAIFQWYLVTFDEPGEKITGSWDPRVKTLKTDHKDKQKLETRLQELSDDPNIESVELNYIVYLAQTDTEHPTAPTNLTTTNITPTSVTLSWNPSTDNVAVARYYIFRNNVSSSENTTTELSFTDTKLSPNTSYTFVVVAQDTAGNISNWSNAVVINTPSSTTPTISFTPTPTSISVGSSEPEFTPTPTGIGVGSSAPEFTPTPTPTPSYLPNDPYYASSGAWGQSYPDLWGIKRINAEGAWQQTTGSSSVVVADIDTGIDRNHPDITDNLWNNPGEVQNNGIDDDQNGYVDDYYGWDFTNNTNNPTDDYGHGTSVAGVIGAIGNNALGVVGVNWKTKLMTLKVHNASGYADWANIFRAIQYATDMGAKVVNNSYAGVYSYRYAPLEDTLQYAHDRGVVMIASAGNDNVNALDAIPAHSPFVVAVAAMDQNDQRSVWSSGYASNYGEKIDVTAPGSNVLSPASVYGTHCYHFINTNYCLVDGTSFSAPHVTGLVALMLAKNPTLTNEEIRQILRTSVTDLGTPGQDPYFGYGLINAGNAVSRSNQQKPLAPFISSPQSKTSVAGTVGITGSANGQGFSRYIIEIGLGRTPSNWNFLNTSTIPVSNNTLATINTYNYPAGMYTIRLTAFDTNNIPYYFEVYDITLQVPAAIPTITPTATPTLTPTKTPTMTPTNTPTSVPPTPTPGPLTFSNISVTNRSASQATINWITSGLGTGKVMYGTRTNSIKTNSTLIPTLTTIHTITISGLKKNTTYYYRVYSKNALGVEYFSSIQSFKTTR